MKVVALASLSAFLAVMLGAFGAHGLKSLVSVGDLAIWQTAVTYHMWHSLGLLVLGVVMKTIAALTSLRWVVMAFVCGILLFSGSLYLLVLTNLRGLGAITPLGGLAFLIGWLLLAKISWSYSAQRSTQS